MQAFVLGAGLGTRLRPITDVVPKPLVPVAHEPLITRAFSHLKTAGVDAFVVNTHHLADAYDTAFPEGRWENCPILFRHEPILLETAGGLANVADLLTDDDFWVYNGDILATFDLAPIGQAHRENRAEITLALRSEGPSRHIALDACGRVTDIHGRVSGIGGTHQFTGVYLVSQDFVRRLTPGRKESVIPHFLDVIRTGARIQGVVVDDGFWMDLGDKASYLAAHASLKAPRIHPDAQVDPDADVDEKSFIGPRASVAAGARLRNSIVWADAIIEPGADMRDSVATFGARVGPGIHGDTILTTLPGSVCKTPKNG